MNDVANPMFREPDSNRGTQGGSYNQSGSSWNSSSTQSWDKPQPLRVYENNLVDMRKLEKQVDPTGKKIMPSADRTAELVGVALSAPGSKECLRLKRSVLVHVRCCENPRRAIQMKDILESMLTLNMNERQFGDFIDGLLILYQRLGVEIESVEEFMSNYNELAPVTFHAQPQQEAPPPRAHPLQHAVDQRKAALRQLRAGFAAAAAAAAEFPVRGDVPPGDIGSARVPGGPSHVPVGQPHVPAGQQQVRAPFLPFPRPLHQPHAAAPVPGVVPGPPGLPTMVNIATPDARRARGRSRAASVARRSRSAHGGPVEAAEVPVGDQSVEMPAADANSGD